MIENPFILRGYISDAYFCDREKETIDLIREIKNGNNITLIAPRRIGKTGLVQHVYAQEEIKDKYYTFLVDIYATKTLADFIQELGRSILQSLKPKGTKVVEHFLNFHHFIKRLRRSRHHLQHTIRPFLRREQHLTFPLHHFKIEYPLRFSHISNNLKIYITNNAYSNYLLKSKDTRHHLFLKIHQQKLSIIAHSFIMQVTCIIIQHK